MFLEESNHECVPLTKEQREDTGKLSPLLGEKGIFVQPERLLVPSLYAQFADDIYNFKFRKGDIMVAGFPRSGTTWMQEITWTMANNVDLTPVEEERAEIYLRSPYFEHDMVGGFESMKLDPVYYKNQKKLAPQDASKMLDWYNVMEDRRVFKTHIFPSLLNPTLLENSKIVYMVRDPRDACVSAYFQFKTMKIVYDYNGTMEEYSNFFLRGNVLFGDMANHLRQWMPYKHHKNVHFVHYEHLKQDTSRELQKLDEFLGTKLTKSQLEKIEDYISFSKMTKKKTILNASEANQSGLFKEYSEDARFNRKGIIGDFKDKFSTDKHKLFNEYIRNNYKDLDLEYQYKEYEIKTK